MIKDKTQLYAYKTDPRHRLDLLSNKTIKRITDFLEVKDVIELSLINKTLHEKVEQNPQIKIRILNHNYKNTKQRLEVKQIKKYFLKK